jgi:hypothetical protein
VAVKVAKTAFALHLFFDRTRDGDGLSITGESSVSDSDTRNSTSQDQVHYPGISIVIRDPRRQSWDDPHIAYNENHTTSTN